MYVIVESGRGCLFPVWSAAPRPQDGQCPQPATRALGTTSLWNGSAAQHAAPDGGEHRAHPATNTSPIHRRLYYSHRPPFGTQHTAAPLT